MISFIKIFCICLIVNQVLCSVIPDLLDYEEAEAETLSRERRTVNMNSTSDLLANLGRILQGELHYRVFFYEFTFEFLAVHNLIQSAALIGSNNPQYDEPDLNKSQKFGPKTPPASKVIPLGSRITIV